MLANALPNRFAVPTSSDWFRLRRSHQSCRLGMRAVFIASDRRGVGHDLRFSAPSFARNVFPNSASLRHVQSDGSS